MTGLWLLNAHKDVNNKCMKPVGLKEWMQLNGKTVVDIATALHIHPNTVYRYLHGKPVHRSTEVAIERLIEGALNSNEGAFQSVGLK